MDRIERSKRKFTELFGDTDFSAFATDSEFTDILNNFIFGDVFDHGRLTDKQRELITLVVLTTNQTLEEVKVHVKVAMNVGLTPVEIKEALYQCAPYIGFPKALNAIYQANEAFVEQGVQLPLEGQKQVEESTRFEEGLKVQKFIFGDVIDQMQASTPKNQKHIQEYLTAMCFGDFYTRSGLDMQTRELLTLCIVSALGGCESQVKAHVKGNLNVGNDKEILIEAITQCLLYMGFPRSLNALNCINEMAPEEPN